MQVRLEGASDRPICAIGDIHGHLQLGLCMAARWQKDLNVAFEAVFLCGDVGSFTADEQLDSATRRHAKANACELEFLHQWSRAPQPSWLTKIFEPEDEGGLGLLCPVAMVHGNHEGFAHLATLAPGAIPEDGVDLLELPPVDTGGHIRYLPSGWRCRTQAGLVVAGVGGIERRSRFADYHPMAIIDDNAVTHLLDKQVDVLVTHQGPSGVQGEKGSETLQLLLEAGVARAWFHGHSISNHEIVRAGPDQATLVVPLDDIAFPITGEDREDPGDEGLAFYFPGAATVCRGRPQSWRDYRKGKWKEDDEHRLVCPDLARWI